MGNKDKNNYAKESHNNKDGKDQFDSVAHFAEKSQQRKGWYTILVFCHTPSRYQNFLNSIQVLQFLTLTTWNDFQIPFVHQIAFFFPNTDHIPTFLMCTNWIPVFQNYIFVFLCSTVIYLRILKTSVNTSYMQSMWSLILNKHV